MNVVRERLVSASKKLQDNSLNFFGELEKFLNSDAPRLEKEDFEVIQSNLEHLDLDKAFDVGANFIRLANRLISGRDTIETISYAIQLADMVLTDSNINNDIIEPLLFELKKGLRINCALTVPFDKNMNAQKEKQILSWLAEALKLESLIKKLQLKIPLLRTEEDIPSQERLEVLRPS